MHPERLHICSNTQIPQKRNKENPHFTLIVGDSTEGPFSVHMRKLTKESGANKFLLQQKKVFLR